jgi:phage N-6-adenine-methyltransferase
MVVGMKPHALDVIFKSNSDEWATPEYLVAQFSELFGPFDLDPCATPQNAKTGEFFTKYQNGLQRKWFGRVWMNPPYSEVAEWMQKAYESVDRGDCERVVCLVPARTDTRWWHDWVAGKGTVMFLKGRVKFGDAKFSAPFPSAIIVYGWPK